MTLAAIVFAGLMLAYANGANDNFKGVASLFGSGTASYGQALAWATATTLAGSLTALVLAGSLLAAFSGKGLVPLELVNDPNFPASVGLAAGATVLLATRLGFPISTTHALIGSLVGAGLVASAEELNWTQLGDGFLLPLLSSPLIAIVLAAAIYPLLSGVRRRLGVSRETCVCIGSDIVATVPGTPGTAVALRAASSVTVADEAVCRVRYRGHVLGVSVATLVDSLHFLSAGAVCFARGVNDTPKIAALLLVGGLFPSGLALCVVGLVMALGGVLSARRVAQTMSYGISDLNPGQGLMANLVTASLVIGASRFGLPVSTTHVSCGALFGIGVATRQAHWRTIGQIALAWLITLPLAAALGATFMGLLSA